MFSRLKPKTEKRPRAFTRYTPDEVTCELGPLLDLSRGGLRTRIQGKCAHKPGDKIKTFIKCEQGKIVLDAQVRWVRRKGLSAFELGLLFLDLDPNTATAIEVLAEYGFIGQTAPGYTAKLSDAFNNQRNRKRKFRPLPNRTGPDTLDYYELLGVSPAASERDIKRAYRMLAKECHPDTAAEDHDPARFIALNGAYEILIDPAKRAKYDRKREGR